MIASFLPPESAQLTEATSIALAKDIERTDIPTPLSAAPIATAYVYKGSGGIPIMLLHGFDSSVFEFRRLLPLLAASHETWAVDLLGFGFTDRPVDSPFTPAAIKTHLYDFWKTLIARPMILVGASMGGAAAIDFALTYPDAVQKLVLIDSAGFARGPAIARFLFPPLGELAANFLRSPGVRRKVSLQAYREPTFASPDALICAALHLQSPNWQQAIIAFTKSGGYNFLADKIAAIDQPTLILWGDSDKILGTQDAVKFQQAIAHSKLVWVENCGHVPHLEKPHFTVEQILAFSS
ncbi:alpha/beta fold hydrolase [Stenomitos frigidus]|uniref:2-hydroxy-6-oxohepta-2,4-dienoate hydrolase n=1 Tax=Stenomitos frigidus ULC18 TaxID=2107698 RepID=A0A2T1ENZ7_9CYAN|nr:alpha/beta hydrolase [Stenomitos frigidus]PSB34441.1 2-hydroxy-6-oxohepta-2,4-dienoate hydrolase [Stenomitos frigidus ULC18]